MLMSYISASTKRKPCGIINQVLGHRTKHKKSQYITLPDIQVFMRLSRFVCPNIPAPSGLALNHGYAPANIMLRLRKLTNTSA